MRARDRCRRMSTNCATGEVFRMKPWRKPFYGGFLKLREMDAELRFVAVRRRNLLA